MAQLQNGASGGAYIVLTPADLDAAPGVISCAEAAAAGVDCEA
jgi:hypothetical protein